MMPEPAQRAGNAPRNTPEQGRSRASSQAAPRETPSDYNCPADGNRPTDGQTTDDRNTTQATRLPTPALGVRRRSVHEQWLRRRLLERQPRTTAPRCGSPRSRCSSGCSGIRFP